MTESKRVFWQFEVEGEPDEAREEKLKLEAKVEEYSDQSKVVKKSVNMVRNKVSRMKHMQWRMESNMNRDIARAEAIQGNDGIGNLSWPVYNF